MPLDTDPFVTLEAPQSLGTTASGISFATSTGDVLEISSHGPGAFRLRVGPRTRPDYGLVQARGKACTTRRRDDGMWTVAAGDATLEVGGSPIRFRLLWQGAVVLESATDRIPDGHLRLPPLGRAPQGSPWIAAFGLATGETVHGLGEGFGSLDRRGQAIVSQVAEAPDTNTGRTGKPVPFAWGIASGGAWGVFANTPARVSHHIGNPEWSHRSYALLVDDEALDLFVFAAALPAGIVDLCTQVTGRAPALPDWSLGVWLSVTGSDSARAIDVVAEVRTRRIPCDVLVVDDPLSPDEAPAADGSPADPQRQFAELSQRAADAGLRLCVTDHPGIPVTDPLFVELAARGYLLTDDHGDPYLVDVVESGARVPSAIVDFTEAAAVEWWGSTRAELLEQGVSAFRLGGAAALVADEANAANGDTGERLRNAYPVLYQQCVFETTARFQPARDALPVVLSPSAWAGSQRFPVATGAPMQADWEGLAAAIRGALSWGMSGGGFYAADVGAVYAPADNLPELYVRSLQVGAFHSHLVIAGEAGREPWAFGSEAEAVARKWLAFRYRLVPYLRHAAQEASRTGLPVMRAMPLAFPGNRWLAARELQFMCGDALLVAPIVRAGGEVEVVLPPGAWYDLNSRQRLAGGRAFRYQAKLDQFPVFGREGCALPLAPAVQHTGQVDAGAPIERLWLFGKPQQPLTGFAQAAIESVDGKEWRVVTRSNVRVEVFGDAAGVSVETRD